MQESTADCFGRFLNAGKYERTDIYYSKFSLIFGGIFLYTVFSFKESDVIDESTVTILYGVFTGVTVFGVIVLALLRIPRSSIPSSSRSADSAAPDSSIHEPEPHSSNIDIISECVFRCFHSRLFHV